MVLGGSYSAEHDATRFISSPIRFRNGSFAAHGFGLGGFHVTDKVDQRPTLPIMRPFVVNAASELRAYLMPLEETPEFSWMQEVAQAERKGGLRD